MQEVGERTRRSVRMWTVTRNLNANYRLRLNLGNGVVTGGGTGVHTRVACWLLRVTQQCRQWVALELPSSWSDGCC